MAEVRKERVGLAGKVGAVLQKKKDGWSPGNPVGLEEIPRQRSLSEKNLQHTLL